jgi:hypothetical protein
MNLTSISAGVALMQGTSDVTNTITTTDNRTFTIGHDDLDYSTTYMIKIEKTVENLTSATPLWMDYSTTFTTLKRPNATVTGFVLDSEGSPIEKANVSYEPYNAISQTDGSYILNIEMFDDIISNSTITADGKAAGYDIEENSGVALISGQTTSNVNFTLEKLPPELTIIPGDGDTDVAIDTDVELVFNYQLDTTDMYVVGSNDTLNQSFFNEFFELEGVSSVSGTFVLGPDNKSITFDPDANLAEDTEYTLTLQPMLEYTGESFGKPLYWEHSITFTTRAPVENTITVTSVEPSGNDVAIDEEIEIIFSMSLNQSLAQGAFSISPVVENITFNWTDDTTLKISHNEFEYNTSYTVTISETDDVADGYSLASYSHQFTTMQEPVLYDIEVGPIKDDAGNKLKGADVEVTLPNGSRTSVKTDEDGIAIFPDQPWEEFPEGTKFKASHKDYVDDIEWEHGEDIPEFKTGTLPFYVFIVIGVVLLVVLIIIIIIILYGGRKEEEEIVDEGEEGQFECPECGTMVSAEASSCQECGESFEEDTHRCPECGAKIDADTTTCDECGAEFEVSEE